MERLASGKRINSAADDAAGLAISNRMTSQIRGLDQAVRNANDGISMIQTAEGALDESTNILQRIRELSIQSANGIYADDDRATLDAEAQQLLSELDRIAETTSFNGRPLLDGSGGSVALQVGAEANQTIAFEIPAVTTERLGLGTSSSDLGGDSLQLDSTTGTFSGAMAAGAVKINGEALASRAAGSNLQVLLDDINNNVSDVSASAVISAEAGSVGDGVLLSSEILTITGYDFDGGERVYSFSDTSSLQELVDKINGKAQGTIEASISDAGRLQLDSSNLASITILDPTSGTASGTEQPVITSIDEDVEAIVDGLTTHWIYEAEEAVFAALGIRGDGGDMVLNLESGVDSDGPFGKLASVSYDSGSDLLTLNIDTADFTNTNQPNGGTAPVYSDRVIGHEITHAVMFAALPVASLATIPTWFLEGAAEFVHGADNRVSGDLSGSSANALANTLDNNDANWSGSSAEYSAGYLAVKMMDAEIRLASGGAADIKDVITRLDAGDNIDTALNTVAAAHGIGTWNSSASFVTHFTTNGFGENYINGAYLNGQDGELNLLDADTGSVLGSDYGANTSLNALDVFANNGGGLSAATNGSNDFNFIIPEEYLPSSVVPGQQFSAQLQLEHAGGEAISIELGSSGSVTDLATLGFREVSSDRVQGSALDASAQNTALVQGDLSINGIDVAATTAAQGLAGKVENINDLTAQTGVVASIRAEQSFALDASLAPVEITASSAYSAPDQSYQNLTPANGYAAQGGDFSTNSARFTVTDMANVSYTVILSQNHGNVADLLADINGNLPALDEISASSAPGGTDDSFFPADFSATAASQFSFDVTDKGGHSVTVDIDQNFTDANSLVSKINYDLTKGLIATDAVDLTTHGQNFGGGNSVTFDLTDDANGFTTTVTLDTNMTAGDIDTVLADINDELSEQRFLTSPGLPSSSAAAFNFNGNAATFTVNNADGTNNTLITLNADYTDLNGLVAEINNQLIADTADVQVQVQPSGQLAFIDSSAPYAGPMSLDFASQSLNGHLEAALGQLAGSFDDVSDSLVASGSSISAVDDGSGTIQFTSSALGLITVDNFTANGGVNESDTEALLGGGIDLGSGGGTTAGSSSVFAYLDADGVLAFRDVSSEAGTLTVDNFTAVGGSFTAGSADALLGMAIEAGAPLTGSQQDTLEAYIDGNGTVAFRDPRGGQNDIRIDATSLSWSGTPGVLNDALGFDIEDLAGSGASSSVVFTGAAEAFTINDTVIDLVVAQADGIISATEIATAVNEQVAVTGVSAYVDEQDRLHFSSSEAFTLGDDPNSSGFVENLDAGGTLAAGSHNSVPALGSLVINGFEIANIDLQDLNNAVTTINSAQASTGVRATIDDNGEMQLVANSAISLEVGQNNGLATGAALGLNFVDVSDGNNGGADGVMDSLVVRAGIELRAIDESQPIQVDVTDNGAAATGLLDLNVDLDRVTGSALANLSIASQSDAQAAITSVDAALEEINGVRSDLGAASNRLEFTISNLMNISENTAAARSRIVDADFAGESARLSRAQVLQQASQAMLAQANSMPSQVMSLLRG